MVNTCTSVYKCSICLGVWWPFWMVYGVSFSVFLKGVLEVGVLVGCLLRDGLEVGSGPLGKYW